MPIRQTPEEVMQGLEYLISSLPNDIQSTEALQVEADFRLGKLQDMIEGGEWEVDAMGNVIPTSMSDEHKLVVCEHSKFCIIDQIPVLEGMGAEQIGWRALGSIIHGRNVIYSGQQAYTNFSFIGSTVACSSFKV